MIKTLVLYESRYGFTKMIAKQLSLILGPAKCCRIEEQDSRYQNYDYIILCAPVYSERIDSRILSFVLQNSAGLKQKKVIALCTCLAVNFKDKYIKPLSDILGESILFSAAIPGELIIEKLNESDFELLKGFGHNTGFMLKDYRLFEQDKFITMVLGIKQRVEQSLNAWEDKRLFSYFEAFLKEHNTCVLSTGYGTRIRATPIEYIYRDGLIYLISEGGEKFANILLNKNVSIGIFNSYQNMNQLGGMQITGTAAMVGIGSEEYISFLKEKGLDYEKVIKFPVVLNLIRIKISKIEFLWSEFKAMGLETKQIASLK